MIENTRHDHKNRSLSLTKRGQHVVAGLITAAGVVGFAGGRMTAHDSGDVKPKTPEATVSYVVQPGDTAWSIARHAHGDGEIRPLVDELQHEANGALQPGEVLHVPVNEIQNPDFNSANNQG